MSLGSVGGILRTLLLLAGLWILFLVAAHLILDIEQGKVYFESLRFSPLHGTGNEKLSVEEALYIEAEDGQ